MNENELELYKNSSFSLLRDAYYLTNNWKVNYGVSDEIGMLSGKMRNDLFDIFKQLIKDYDFVFFSRNREKIEELWKDRSVYIKFSTTILYEVFEFYNIIESFEVFHFIKSIQTISDSTFEELVKEFNTLKGL